MVAAAYAARPSLAVIQPPCHHHHPPSPPPCCLAKCKDRGCRLTVVRHGNPPLITNYCIYCFPWLYFRPHPFCSQDILTYPPDARLQLCAVAASQHAFVVSELTGTATATAAAEGGGVAWSLWFFLLLLAYQDGEMVRDACKMGQRCLARFHPIRLLEHAAAVALLLRSCPDEWRVSHADGKPVGLAHVELACSCCCPRSISLSAAECDVVAP